MTDILPDRTSYEDKHGDVKPIADILEPDESVDESFERSGVELRPTDEMRVALPSDYDSPAVGHDYRRIASAMAEGATQSLVQGFVDRKTKTPIVMVEVGDGRWKSAWTYLVDELNAYSEENDLTADERQKLEDYFRWLQNGMRTDPARLTSDTPKSEAEVARRVVTDDSPRRVFDTHELAAGEHLDQD